MSVLIATLALFVAPRIAVAEDAPSGGSFTSLSKPERLLDTRPSGTKVGEIDGTGAAYSLQVGGEKGVPSSGVAAVALNVTVVDGEAGDYGGFVTVYPCGTRPDASNLNFTSGQTIPNSVIAPVSAVGKVCFYVYGKAHLLADVSGYFSSGFSSLSKPERLLDTRPSGTKVGEIDGTGAAYSLQVGGEKGVPSSGVAAVALNVTVVDGEAGDYGGFVTVYPCGTRPDASNLNFTSGQTIPNSVIAPVSSAGKVCFYVYGKAHLLADVSGYFSSAVGLRYLASAERVVPRARTGSQFRDGAQEVLVAITDEGELSDLTLSETGELAVSDTLQDLVVEHLYDAPNGAVVIMLGRSVVINDETCHLLYLESDLGVRCIDSSITQIDDRTGSDRPAYNPSVQFDDDGRVWFSSFGVGGSYLKRWDPVSGVLEIVLQESDFTGDNALDPENENPLGIYNFIAFSDSEAERFGAVAMVMGTADRCVNDDTGTGGTLPNGDRVADCYRYQWLFARVKSVGDGVESTVLQLDEVTNLPAFIRLFEGDLFTTFDDNERWGIYAYSTETDEFSLQVFGDSRQSDPVPTACTDPSRWAVCMAPHQAWGYFDVAEADGLSRDVVSVAISGDAGDAERLWQFNRLDAAANSRDGLVSMVSSAVTYERSGGRTQGVIRQGDDSIFIAGQTAEGDSVIASYDPVTNTETLLVGPGAPKQSAQVDVFFEVTSMTQDGNLLAVVADVGGSEVIGSLDLTTGELTIVDVNPSFTNIDNLTNFVSDTAANSN